VAAGVKKRRSQLKLGGTPPKVQGPSTPMLQNKQLRCEAPTCITPQKELNWQANGSSSRQQSRGNFTCSVGSCHSPVGSRRKSGTVHEQSKNLCVRFFSFHFSVCILFFANSHLSSGVQRSKEVDHLCVHDGTEVILREYSQKTKNELYTGLNDLCVQNHIDLQASVSSGFSRSDEGHRMAGKMDLYGQRRQRSGTVWKTAGQQATYTTVCHFCSPLVLSKLSASPHH
jgi:hypothetical protein